MKEPAQNSAAWPDRPSHILLCSPRHLDPSCCHAAPPAADPQRHTSSAAVSAGASKSLIPLLRDKPCKGSLGKPELQVRPTPGCGCPTARPARDLPAPGNEGLKGDEQCADRGEAGNPFPPCPTSWRPTCVPPHLDNTTLFEEVCQILQGHIIIESLHVN